MSKIIRWFIQFLSRVGVFTHVYPIIYQGQGVSLNQYYSSGHWSRRANLKNKYKKIFDEIIEDMEIQPMERFSLVVFFNSRHDTDNVTGLEKLFLDTLKGKYIEDDAKKYFRFFAIVPDEELELNTFEFYLIAHGNINNNIDRRLTAEVVSSETIPRL